MECNRVEVHYTNNGIPGVYEVSDLAVNEEDETKVHCSWLLSQNATKEVGSLHFLLRFACVAEDGIIDYAWNTAKFKGISISEGLYNSESIAEKYADVLEQWKQDLKSSGIFELWCTRLYDGEIGKETIITETTYEEIKQAAMNGKLVICHFSSATCFCSGGGLQSEYWFYGVGGGVSYALVCTDENNWQCMEYSLNSGDETSKEYINEAINNATPGIVDAVIEALPNGDEVYY